MNAGTKKSLTFLLPVLSLLSLLAVAEASLRLYHLLRWDMSPISGEATGGGEVGGLITRLDPKLGWRAGENYRFEGTKYNADGTAYSARISQDERGFRMFGDLDSDAPRILVIGDSFTQAIDASDDKTYYAVVGDLLPVEVFAYGAGGYGSLQEFMILDKYFDLIDPDLILWQYTTNDLINNSVVLETASLVNNNSTTRPYLIDGEIRYMIPAGRSRALRSFALRYCRMCYTVLTRSDRLRADPGRTVETMTSPGESAHSQFLDAVHTTDRIMADVRRRAATVPIVAFVVGVGDPEAPEYEEGLAEVSRRNDILLLEGIDWAVSRAEQSGAVVRAADGAHWNETGHRIAGEEIAASLRRICVLGLCCDEPANGAGSCVQ